MDPPKDGLYVVAFENTKAGRVFQVVHVFPPAQGERGSDVRYKVISTHKSEVCAIDEASRLNSQEPEKVAYLEAIAL
jgi:hypothetical protein